MRAKRVYEFEKTGNPKRSLKLGKESEDTKLEVLKEFTGMGIDVGSDDKMKEILDHFWEIADIVNKLLDLNVPPEHITILNSHTINVRPYEILDGNAVILETISESDAQFLIDSLRRLSKPKGFRRDLSYRLSYFSTGIYFREPGGLEFLEGLKEARKEFGIK